MGIILYFFLNVSFFSIFLLIWKEKKNGVSKKTSTTPIFWETCPLVHVHAYITYHVNITHDLSHFIFFPPRIWPLWVGNHGPWCAIKLTLREHKIYGIMNSMESMSRSSIYYLLPFFLLGRIYWLLINTHKLWIMI